jgi:peptidyl-prolyl cis-trans isomerase C
MKINKKTVLATALISLAFGSSMLIADEKATTDAVIATVNGDNIMKSTLDGYLAVLNKSGKKVTNKQAAIDDLVATEIALQEARKSSILDRPEVKKLIKDYTRNVLLKTWTKEKVDSFDISDDTVKAAYDERVTKLASKEYNARHILVKTADEAKAIIKELDGGADFAKLAKEKSTGPSGSNGGSLCWFKAQTMVPAFANAVKTMSKGDTSKEPVKTQFGYHIIKVEDSRNTKLPTLDSMKTQLKRVIAQKKMLAYMVDLRKTADVKITLPEEPTEADKATEETKKEN